MKTIDESYFSESKSGNNIEDILEDGEKILWQSKPKRKSYILSAFTRLLPIAIIWLFVDGSFITMMFAFNVPREMLWFIIPFFALHLLPVWIWIASVIKAAAEVNNIHYAFTGKRIIVRSGVIGIDYKYVYYDKIEAVKVKVGLVDRLNKVGDIYITAPGAAAVLYDQDDPYQLATKLQKIAVDIKADISFPNAYRPENNPGYNTSYNSEDKK